MNLGPWQELDSFDGSGTFLVGLGAGTGRVRWLAWKSNRILAGEANDEAEAQRKASEGLVMLGAMDEAARN